MLYTPQKRGDVMIKAIHRRHDISDEVWNRLKQCLLSRKGIWGGVAEDNRRFINAVSGLCAQVPHGVTFLRIIATRVICTVFPSAGGIRDLWERLMETLIDEPDYEWLMIDASHCKVHPHGSGARDGNQAISRTKGSSASIGSGEKISILMQLAPALHLDKKGKLKEVKPEKIFFNYQLHYTKP